VSSCRYVKQQKTLFIPHSREGRRAFYADFVVPPSFARPHGHQPRRVLPFESADCEAVDAQRRCRPAFQGINILEPVNGGLRQRSTFAQSRRFLLAAPGFIHSALTYGLSTTRPLSGRNKQLLLVPSKLLLYTIVRFVLVHDWDEGQIKTPFILHSWEGRRAINRLSWYHLHLSMSRGINLVEYYLSSLLTAKQ